MKLMGISNSVRALEKVAEFIIVLTRDGLFVFILESQLFSFDLYDDNTY